MRRRQPRINGILPVRIWGIDRRGEPFSEHSCTATINLLGTEETDDFMKSIRVQAAGAVASDWRSQPLNHGGNIVRFMQPDVSGYFTR